MVNVTTPQDGSAAPRSLPPPQGILLGFATLLAAIIFVVDLFTPLGVADGVLYPTVIAVTHWGGRPRVVVLAACGCSGLILAGLAFSPEGASPSGTVLLNRAMSLAEVWGLAAGSVVWLAHERRTRLLDRDRDHHRKEPLCGLLPICAACKKIRDPEGRWHQLEAYIRDHYEVKFTHSLCAGCLADYSGVAPEELAERNHCT
jgi:hypothetical protein